MTSSKTKLIALILIGLSLTACAQEKTSASCRTSYMRGEWIDDDHQTMMTVNGQCQAVETGRCDGILLMGYTRNLGPISFPIENTNHQNAIECLPNGVNQCEIEFAAQGLNLHVQCQDGVERWYRRVK